jgi:undecaprenyl-diphosphatase
VAAGLATLIALSLLCRDGPIGLEGPLAYNLRELEGGPSQWLWEPVNLVAGSAVWVPAALLAAAVLWWRGERAGAVLLVLGLGVEVVTLGLKLAVQRPAPLTVGPPVPFWAASFPSGHAARAVVGLGVLLAVLAWRSARWRVPAVLASAGFLVVLGLGRVVEGAHWPTDVAGGYLVGGLWLELLLVRWSLRHSTPAGKGDA